MISRRTFNAAALATTAMSAISAPSFAAERPGIGWRRFQVTTCLDLVDAERKAQAWIPLSSFNEPDWVRSEGNTWATSASAKATQVTSNGAALLHVQWDKGPSHAEVTSTFVTRDRFSPLTGPKRDAGLSPAERALYLSGSSQAPTKGIVKDIADKITVGKTDQVEKARAIYEWVVLNTFRSAPVPGCGDGDVVRMLRSGVLGGKCADINPLFVALARASGLPARDLYGIRVAPSRLGYRSLGPATPTVTKVQHCRAEVFLDGFGWTAMDPADVRKVMLEEAPQGLTLDDPQVEAARVRLFGSWEGNWVPFNAANDVVLPGVDSTLAANFLMYPQVATTAGMLDCYDPAKVRYEIMVKELAI